MAALLPSCLGGLGCRSTIPSKRTEMWDRRHSLPRGLFLSQLLQKACTLQQRWKKRSRGSLKNNVKSKDVLMHLKGAGHASTRESCSGNHRHAKRLQTPLWYNHYACTDIAPVPFWRSRRTTLTRAPFYSRPTTTATLSQTALSGKSRELHPRPPHSSNLSNVDEMVSNSSMPASDTTIHARS